MKITRFLTALGLFISVLTFFGGVTFAIPAPTAGNCPNGSYNSPPVGAKDPSKHQDDPALSCNNCADLSHCDLITKFVNPLIALVSAFVGVAVVIAIIYGGIEYGSSGGDPSKAAAGKKRIRNALIGLIAFFFFYGLLNFLIPGGIG